MATNLKELISYGKNLNILFVEDNEEVRLQLQKLLLNFFSNIDIAEDGEIAYNKYLEYKSKNDSYYDIIITDLSMPKMDGIEFTENIIKINPFQVIVVISAHTESSKLLKLIEIGVYKFLRKPVDYKDILTHFSSIISKIKREKRYEFLEEKLIELKKENEVLNEQVVTDKLTSIFNRRYLDNLLISKFNELRNNGISNSALILIFIDIDNFKEINDDYGHIHGDKILIEFSNILKNSIRKSDIVGRWGGEEFVIILENTTIDDALEISEKIRTLIENFTFEKIEKLTASFGLATYKENDSITSLIQRADYSLYKAKDEGKNRVCFI